METSHSLKVLFLIFHGFSEHNGISKKVLGQVDGLRRCGSDVRLCHCELRPDGHWGWFINNSLLVDLNSGLEGKLRKRMDFRAIIQYVKNEKIKLVYMRSDHNANPFTVRMLSKIRELGCRTLMEIPTFPYDNEYSTFKMRLFLGIDRFYRHTLARHLDWIVTFTDSETIFDQKTIRISNGIDFGKIPVRNIIKNSNYDAIHFIAVAEIHFWHGFDRLIAGLINCNFKVNGQEIIFHMVGALSGVREEMEILHPIKKLGLEKKVILYGPLHGRQLDDLFQKADLAIGSLGRHRTGIDIIRTLKNREYAARGIPFIYSETDPDFDEKPYVFKIPADESPIDVKSVVNFLKINTWSPCEIRKSIEHLSWKFQMQHILDEVKLTNDDMI